MTASEEHRGECGVDAAAGGKGGMQLRAKQLLIVVPLLYLLLFGAVSTVLAAEPSQEKDQSRIYVGEDVALEPGVSVNGDLGVLRGNLTVPEGCTVNGDLFVVGGDLSLAGRLNGNLVVLGGDVVLAGTGLVLNDSLSVGGQHEVSGHVRGSLSVFFGDVLLRSSAVVDGDLFVTPGHVERESGAKVRGQEVLGTLPFWRGIRLGAGASEPENAGTPAGPQGPLAGTRGWGTLARVLSAALLTVGLWVVGILIVLIWPRHTGRVAECIASLPAQSFGLGLLSYLLAITLELLSIVGMVLIILLGALLTATVVLIPVGVALMVLAALLLFPVPLAMAAGVLVGWVGLARLIGRRLLSVGGARLVTPLAEVGLGLLITVPVAGGLWVLQPALCAWPFVALLTSIGLGAVFHTRFGTQTCRPSPKVAEDSETVV